MEAALTAVRSKNSDERKQGLTILRTKNLPLALKPSPIVGQLLEAVSVCLGDPDPATAELAAEAMKRMIDSFELVPVRGCIPDASWNEPQPLPKNALLEDPSTRELLATRVVPPLVALLPRAPVVVEGALAPLRDLSLPALPAILDHLKTFLQTVPAGEHRTSSARTANPGRHL